MSSATLRNVQSHTRKLWDKQNRHPGDRHRLFGAVARVCAADHVLYPGSYVDIAASFVWPSVTYLDEDDRASRFFEDDDGVRELLVENGADPAQRSVQFVHGDYTGEVDLTPASFDLLISLYAGPISQYCTRFLGVDGHLLVNPSHGDAALASLRPEYQLVGVMAARDGEYSVRTEKLDTYLIPKGDVTLTTESVLQSGRGVAYTKPAFAYLFQRTS